MDLADELFEDDEKDKIEMDKEIKLVNLEGIKEDIDEDMNNEAESGDNLRLKILKSILLKPFLFSSLYHQKGIKQYKI